MKINLNKNNGSIHIAISVIVIFWVNILINFSYLPPANAWEVIEYDVDHPYAYRELGISYAMKGQYEMAAEQLNKFLKIRPDDPYALYHLAYVYEKLGIKSEAKKSLAAALIADPDILNKMGKYLFKPLSKSMLKFYAKEYLFASKQVYAPEVYVSKARKILETAEESNNLGEIKLSPSDRCISSYPNRYLLGILVSRYEELTELPFVKGDKVILLKLATCYLGVPKKNILILENPSLATLRRKLRKFARQIKRKDSVLFFYYSGHGIVDTKGQLYLLPCDASVEEEQILTETSLSLREVEEKLLLAKGYKLAIIDACRTKAPWKPGILVKKIKSVPKSMAILFATSFSGLSFADKSHKSSAFLKTLYYMAAHGIDNLDFDGSGYVELKELIKPLKVKLTKISAGSQKPQLIGRTDIPVFPVK